MSATRMLPPHVMYEHYGIKSIFRASPAQRRRIRHKLRKIYGWTHAERQEWIGYWAKRGVKIP